MHLSTGATGAALLALPAATAVAALGAARLPAAVPPARVSALGFAVIVAGATATLRVTGAALLASGAFALGGAGLILLAGRADGRAPESAIARAA